MAVSCTPQDLLANASEFCCITGNEQTTQAVKLYLLRSIAGLDAQTPQQLLAAASCWFSCVPQGAYKAVEAYLLCQIANAGTATCGALAGDAPPTGVVTPDFIGQLYNRNNGDEFYYSTGLTNADWVLISGGASGMVWGPDITSIDAFIIPVNFESSFGDSITTLEFPSLITYTANSDNIEFQSGFLETVSFPALTTVGNFGFIVIHDSPALTALTFPVLATVGTSGGLDFSNNTALPAFSAPSLTSIGKNFLMTGCSSLASISLPSLTTLGTSGSNCNLDISGNTALTDFSAPSLTSIRSKFNASGNSLLITLTLTQLVSVGIGSAGNGLFLPSCSSLTTLNLPALTTIAGDTDSSNCTSLSSVLVPNWVPNNGTSIDFSGDALDATSVELILSRCVLAGVATCTITLTGGTNAGLASLSAQGQTDFATLFGAGNTITINA